jgi:hypothetical protein
MDSIKITHLYDLAQTFVMLICRKDNEKQLVLDWNRMLEDYSILCDLWSNIIVAKGGALQSIETLDKMGESGWSQPAPSTNVDRYEIFVCEKYFANNSIDQRKAILLHELGHFYVYKIELLTPLRNDWKKGEDLFNVFIAPLEKHDRKNINSYREWFKRFYINYVFDLLKLPGEYFANLWIKQNFGDVFNSLLESKYDANRFFLSTDFSIIQKSLIKFPVFLLILRISALIVLTDNKLMQNRFVMLKKECYGILQKNTNKKEFKFLKEFEKRTIKLSTSIELANKQLITVLEEYILKFPIKKVKMG